ncbi:hypothetical protein D3C78_1217760 [compost metagenome]
MRNARSHLADETKPFHAVNLVSKMAELGYIMYSQYSTYNLTIRIAFQRKAVYKHRFIVHHVREHQILFPRQCLLEQLYIWLSLLLLKNARKWYALQAPPFRPLFMKIQELP